MMAPADVATNLYRERAGGSSCPAPARNSDISYQQIHIVPPG